MPKFLVIDDSPIVRQLIAYALSKIEGAEIVEASDGLDALRKMMEDSFDLIMADINMPMMDGLKLVYLLRKSPSVRKIPIVFVTTEGSEADRDKGLQLGAAAYIAKPIYGPKLRQVVRELLGRPRDSEVKPALQPEIRDQTQKV